MKPHDKQTGPHTCAGATIADGTTSQRILCRKCAHSSPGELESCRVCGHSLYVTCHCGARVVRSHDRCGICGDRLRRRRVDPDDVAFKPINSIASGAARGRSGDLGVAMMLFGLVSLVIGAVLLTPLLEAYFERIAEAREDVELIRQDSQKDQEMQVIQQKLQLLEQQRREDRERGKLISGH